jgi:hypothetical protein
LIFEKKKKKFVEKYRIFEATVLKISKKKQLLHPANKKPENPAHASASASPLRIDSAALVPSHYFACLILIKKQGLCRGDGVNIPEEE